ncbi:hypothetical protein PPSIR1_12653 [Plesiocystis pacifica SIR-1]|uniref:Uncharacterized protein n=1 Tax=Plesiocystis pacifica SIR-1 TaxID=391625 RepID=A6G035_9BACT|nr:hypothetical protein PPSIR1_12653 [Plesiocystis pacifica SIR-1]
MVLLEGLEGSVEARGHRGHPRQLLRRQAVDILVEGLAGIEALLHAVEAGHEQGREGQVGVAGRVRGPELDADRLGRARVGRDADRRRAVPRAVGQVDRGLEARDQALVAVGARVGERAQRGGVAEHAGDEVQGHLRQARVLLTGEQRLAVLPQRHVRVHAVAVVPVQGLGHEGDRLAGLARDVLDHVLEPGQLVGLGQQRVVADVDLGLSAGRDLHVLALDDDAEILEREDHVGAQVLEAVRGRHGDVAALGADLVPEVGEFLAVRVPVAQVRVDGVEAGLLVAAVADVVEDEELGLGADVEGVGDAGRAQVVLGAGGQRPGAALVVGARDGLDGVAEQDQGRDLHEGVDLGRGRVGHDQHVGGVDGLPTAHRRAVKAEALGEGFLAQLVGRHGEVLPRAEHVDEAQVDHADLLLADEVDDFLGSGLAHGFDPGVLGALGIWVAQKRRVQMNKKRGLRAQTRRARRCGCGRPRGPA